MEDKDILQANATVIAGALVFITISYVATSNTALTGLVGIALALSVIINFGWSSFHIIAGRRQEALASMRDGFVWLVFTAVALLIVILLQSSAEVYKNITSLIH